VAVSPFHTSLDPNAHHISATGGHTPSLWLAHGGRNWHLKTLRLEPRMATSEQSLFRELLGLPRQYQNISQVTLTNGDVAMPLRYGSIAAVPGRAETGDWSPAYTSRMQGIHAKGLRAARPHDNCRCLTWKTVTPIRP
jgi:hypothetical protein